MRLLNGAGLALGISVLAALITLCGLDAHTAAERDGRRLYPSQDGCRHHGILFGWQRLDGEKSRENESK